MDLIEELEKIAEEVRNAKSVPFSASAMINRTELLEAIEAMKESAPEELKQARWLLREREEVMAKTRREADKLLGDARAERDRMVSKTEIVAAAHRAAEKILEEAKAKGRDVRMEAEDYVDAKLANFEVILHKTLGAVAKGRESLRGRAEAAAEKASEAPAEADIAAP